MCWDSADFVARPKFAYLVNGERHPSSCQWRAPRECLRRVGRDGSAHLWRVQRRHSRRLSVLVDSVEPAGRIGSGQRLGHRALHYALATLHLCLGAVRAMMESPALRADYSLSTSRVIGTVCQSMNLITS